MYTGALKKKKKNHVEYHEMNNMNLETYANVM